VRFGEYLVGLLERYGVTHVFGIPGVHTAELYRGLAGSKLRHITPRHEQGAGFMADAFARVTGRPGVCFIITGPGMTNIATAMGQAYQDSIPMLVISSVNSTAQLGHGFGALHELPDQHGLFAKLTAFSHTLFRAEDLPEVMARAFAIFGSSRPRPVHIQIPLDVMERAVDVPPSGPAPVAASRPPSAALEGAARMLDGAESPLLLIGGGARGTSREVTAVAERLDAPAVMTVNARGLMPLGHRLGVSASPSMKAVRRLVEASDVVLAVGTEFGPTDYNAYFTGFSIPGRLIRIEVDPVQMMRNCIPDLALTGDATATLGALIERLGTRRERGGARRADRARRDALDELSPPMKRQLEFLNAIRDALPDAVIVGDSTQIVYAGLLYFEAGAPNGWFNSATGYGTLGYALPASIGAKLGAPERPVICLAGDGGIQFTLGELGSAIDAKAPVIVLVWNNRGYREIKEYFVERGIEPIGCDPTAPDFIAVATAYGLHAEKLAKRGDIASLLKAAAARNIPTLIEIDDRVAMG
jgi:acetolactate synthase I/II/III large subunit